MDRAGREPEDGAGAQVVLGEAVLAGERLHAARAADDHVRLGAAEVQVWRAAVEAVGSDGVVYAEFRDAYRTRQWITHRYPSAWRPCCRGAAQWTLAVITPAGAGKGLSLVV
ncbi:hypothetical protein JCM33774_10890 [Actinophytocola sp. KF-1]